MASFPRVPLRHLRFLLPLFCLALLPMREAIAQDDEDLDEEEIDLGPRPSSSTTKKPPAKGAKKPSGGAPDPFGGEDDEDPEEDPGDGGDEFEGDPEEPEEDPPEEPREVDPFEDDPPEPKPAPKPVAPKPAPKPEAATGGPARISLDTAGKKALADNWPATLVGRDIDAVVVELPLLVAAKAADHKADYWVVTEVLIGDVKVSESRHLVTKGGIAELGPSFIWIKAHVPVADPTGQIRLKLSRMTEGQAAVPLFDRSVAYKL